MSTENFMDRFQSPEEYIRHQILARGNFSCLDKKEMYRLIREHNIDFQPHHNGLRYTKKQDMFEALLTKLSYRDLSGYVEVSRMSFCMKFDITVEEFKTLVEKGLIHKVCEYKSVKFENGSYSKWSQWSGYDVYDYFELTKEQVEEALQ